MEIAVNVNKTFLNDVATGLISTPKRIPSKYFYDEAGDKLFHYIMNQPEYYLTCAEHEILSTKAEDIFSNIDTSNGIRIIEPGAGDGFKTRLIIGHLLEKGFKVVYNPIDISSNVLDILCRSIGEIYPQVLCQPMVSDFAHIEKIIVDDGIPKLMLFLGSTIGNYSHQDALSVLQKFSSVLTDGDFFLLGADLVKDPKRILDAYNDSNGYTARFNYNLLERMNRELGAEFDVDNFIHYPVYNPLLQQAESYLVSKTEQDVYIEAAGCSYHFNAWEPIHTEISRKYTFEVIAGLATAADFNVVENYTDMNRDFCCSLWKK